MKHDMDIAEVMSELCDFYYPGARFIAFPGTVAVSEDGEITLTPGVVVDVRGDR